MSHFLEVLSFNKSLYWGNKFLEGLSKDLSLAKEHPGREGASVEREGSGEGGGDLVGNEL